VGAAGGGGRVRIAAVCGVLRFVSDKFPQLSRLHFHSLAAHVLAHRRALGPTAAAARARSLWRGAAGSAAAGSAAATLEACRAPGGAAELGARQAERAAASPRSLPLLFSASASRFNSQDPAADAAPAPPPPPPGGAPAEAAPLAWPFSAVPEGWLPASLVAAQRAKLPLSEAAPVARFSWAAAGGDAAIDFAVAPVVACREPLSTVGLGDAISAAGLAADLAAGAGAA